MDDCRFDAGRLRSLIESYLAGHATLAFGEDDRVVWIFSTRQGTPIQLRLEEGLCVVLAGFSFRQTIPAGEPGSEWMIIDCIEAIITGHGSEFYDFTSNFLDDERIDGVAGGAFTGRGMGIEAGAASARLVRQIPAWEIIPPRPASTTMDVLWGDGDRS